MIKVRARRVEKLPNAVKKSPACVFIAFHPRRGKQATAVGENKLGAARFCARRPRFGARFLGPLIWSRLRESVKPRAAGSVITQWKLNSHKRSSHEN